MVRLAKRSGEAGTPTSDRQAAKLVARAWRQVLDEQSLRADTPFDAAGGDSLALLRLVFLIEEASGLRLPMEACHLGLRPSDFLQVLRLGRVSAATPLLEPPGTVFLIPGARGQTPMEGGFRAASEAMLHIAAVDFPDWADVIRGQLTMEDLIAQIVAEIVARQPSGDIRLAGYSIGGHFAHGVARALATQGRRVSFVGILDTSLQMHGRSLMPSPRGPAPVRMLRRTYWEAYNVLRAGRRHLPASLERAMVAARLLARPDKPNRLRLAARLRHMPLPSDFAAHLNAYLCEAALALLVRTWRQRSAEARQVIDAPTVLFRARERQFEASRDLGWGAVCTSLRVVDVAGDHLTMLRPPHLAELCARFSEAVAASGHASAAETHALPAR